jgi:mono/diheme cytochrome c family protein
MFRSERFFRILLLLFAVATASRGHGAERPAGLQLAVSAGGAVDLAVWPNAQWFVPAGEAATPFVPAGPFVATWTGFVTSELRAEYAFEAEAAGEVRVELNGAEVFSGKVDASKPLVGPSVKLNKGANALKVELKASGVGDAFLRLYWSNKETPRNPVPVAVLSHDATPALGESLALHEGRDLFFEGRCIRCHAAKSTAAEAGMDAPSLAGIGGRRNEAWLARWIEDPQSMRPGTPMPRLVGGADAKAIAAYLGSLKGTPVAAGKAGDKDAGHALYEKLLCASCHNPPDAPQPDPGKISQKGVKAKFAPGALAAFLAKPEEHFAWIRMPNFKLSGEEAANLAAYLEASADAPFDAPAAADPATIARGRALVESSGCADCHAVDGIRSTRTAKALAEISGERWTEGCLAEAPAEGSKAPRYAFTGAQRAALRVWGKTDHASLGRGTAADFLARQSMHLQCAECHGKHEGFPTWELLGGKLKPEWAARFIGGQEPWKPRTWLEARMPAFPSYAPGLAVGLATRHGLPAVTPAESAGNPEDAEKGRKLVGVNGGFSCVSCHGVGDFAATAVFEAPGINLAHSFERIQPDYFRRWLRSPMSVDPSTKMPVYFDEEGKSPLAEYYGGDGPKTLAAVWEYLRQGSKMAKPE